MTDVLERLRDANPVDPDTLDLPPLAVRPAARRRWALLALPVAGVAVLAVLVLVRGGSADLAARAYAAMSTGIAHWRTETVTTHDGRVTARGRMEGWASRWVTHVLEYDVQHSRARLTTDRRIADGRERMWTAEDDDYTSFAVAKAQHTGQLPGDDPAAAFRRAYREGRLEPIGHNVYRATVPVHGGGSWTIDYELDPSTAVPRRVVSTWVGPAGRDVLTYTFPLYEKLSASAANRAKLRMLPHPGAGPSKSAAADHFAVLRDSGPLSAADRTLLAPLARDMSRFHVDLDGARRLASRAWLVPGRGYVCLMVAAPKGQPLGGVGGTCRTVDRAAEDGLSSGSPGHGWTLAVADGVTRVQVHRYGHSGWRSVAVHRNLVRIPWFHAEWRLVRQ
jgi:hypothetical protein